MSPDRIERRRASVPPIRYPSDLPVSARVDDLAEAIAAHQVVIVAGETGSGKSTQLPKICLALGRGVTGMVGHTQPRRIAARALAERIAQETGTEVGGPIGYSVRFGDHTGPDTLVKLMTDGILLAEIHRDPDLLAYDTLIVDEAHERSLNIDFLLGYVRNLLPRRPDLKVIVTSATIDPEKFSRYFSDAPVVEVSGRTYPVEIRYRPYGVVEAATDDPDDEAVVASDAGEIDQSQAISRAVDELMDAGPGDILVFLSGEREITDTAEVLRGHLTGRRNGPEILPLFGRLSAAEQHRVFADHPGRRIVLSTNVAETSLTVPGVHYVIDPGTARISRYSTRTKVQRLPIEPISQASAGQRAGRCGRVAAGVCIRLYSQADFENRPRFTDPEISRTSLASVILQMAALGLGNIRDFPFLDPPDARQVADGLTVLRELGALEVSAGDEVRLTKVGRAIAALPLDPRLARIVVEGAARGCLDEMLVLAAGLAIQDVREFPLDDRDRAVAAHSRFADPGSDFLALLHLWRHLRREGKARSGNAFRRMCKSEYLHYLRIREWQDLHAQLRQLSRGLGTQTAVPAEEPDPPPGIGRGSLATHPFDAQTIHTALLTGFLSHVGLRASAGREYQGTRGSSFVLWPGSALARRPPELVLAAELVETSRLFGRIAASVQPEWVEAVGGELLRRSYSEPRWSKRRAQVVATEKVTLLGVTLIAARTVAFDAIDPELARELFVRHALVEGDWETRHRFLAANQRAAQEVQDLQDRARRRDLMVDDETVFALYDARIPADITSGQRFDAWWRKASRATPDLLTFTAEMLTATSDGVDAQAFPDTLRGGGAELPLDYVFEPGRDDDGVTVTVPLAVLARLRPDTMPDQIPGHQRDLAIALIRSLPKTLRRLFVPVPDAADRALGALGGVSVTPEGLADALTRLGGIPIRGNDFDLDRLPPHLRLRFRVVAPDGAEVATGLDLDALQRRLRTQTRVAVAQVSGPSIRRSGLASFPAQGVPRRVESVVDGQSVVGYPALVDEGTTVGVDVFADPDEQAAAMRIGTRRLLLTQIPVPTAHVRKGLTRAEQLVLASSPFGSLADLLADATSAAADALLDWAGGPAWDEPAFAALTARLAPQVPRAVLDIARAAIDVVTAGHQVQEAIAALPPAPGRNVQLTDLRARLAALLPPGFLTSTGAAHLPDLARWLQALAIRAQRLRENPERDLDRMTQVNQLAARFDAAVAELPPGRAAGPAVAGVRRLLEELRVAVFAQPLRTAVPASAKRVTAAIEALRG